jgi:hydrogenase maturation protease
MSKTSQNSNRIVIGIGNQYRSDDAAGLLVVHSLLEHNPPGMKIIENSGDGLSLLHQWSSRDRVILVDAVLSKAPAGTVRRYDLLHESLRDQELHFSTHTFSLPEAILLAVQLELLPAALVLFTIDGKNFENGNRVSPAVSRAVAAVSQAIRDL